MRAAVRFVLSDSVVGDFAAGDLANVVDAAVAAVLDLTNFSKINSDSLLESEAERSAFDLNRFSSSRPRSTPDSKSAVRTAGVVAF
jgi:hypothetical protein